MRRYRKRIIWCIQVVLNKMRFLLWSWLLLASWRRIITWRKVVLMWRINNIWRIVVVAIWILSKIIPVIVTEILILLFLMEWMSLIRISINSEAATSGFIFTLTLDITIINWMYCCRDNMRLLRRLRNIWFLDRLISLRISLNRAGL